MEQNARKPFLVTEEILASHGQRFLNLLVDTIMQVALLVVVLGFFVANAEANGNKDFIVNFEKSMLLQYTFTACIALFYYNVFEIFSARTVGKLVTQTIVVDENGEKPNHETILVRSLSRLIPLIWLPFVVSLFMGSSAQGWHDRISKTFVVDKRRLEEEKRLFYSSKSNPNEE